MLSSDKVFEKLEKDGKSRGANGASVTTNFDSKQKLPPVKEESKQNCIHVIYPLSFDEIDSVLFLMLFYCQISLYLFCFLYVLHCLLQFLHASIELMPNDVSFDSNGCMKVTEFGTLIFQLH